MKPAQARSLMFSAVALILVLGFQNCAKTSFASDGGPVAFKSGADGVLGTADDVLPGPDGVLDTEDDIIAGEDNPVDKDEQDADKDADQDGDKRCIGNGIKVPEGAVVACDGGDLKCVEVCVDNVVKVASFRAARSLLKSGASAGACK